MDRYRGATISMLFGLGLIATGTLARANPMYIAVSDGITGWRIEGDPQVTPLTISIGGWLSATLVQDGSRIAITDLTANCTYSSGCQASFDVRTTGAFYYETHSGVLSLDGTVETSNPEGVLVIGQVNAYGPGTLEEPNFYGTAIYNLYGGYQGLLTGDFAGTWSQGPRFVGPITSMTMSLQIAGLVVGDTLTMPGSMGVDLAATPPAAVPEPGSLELLSGILAVLGLSYLGSLRRRQSA